MTGTSSERILSSLIYVLALACAVFLGYQILVMVNFHHFHEEMRLLFIYHRFYDPQLFAGDYLTSFVGAFNQPMLFEGLNRLAAGMGVDLLIFHRMIAIFCWIAFLAGVGLAAKKLGDRTTMVGALAIAIVQPIIIFQITGSLPHSFAFPLLVWAFIALLFNSTVLLAGITLLSGLLYPAIAPITGMLFAWHVLVPTKIAKKGFSVKLADVFVLGATAIATLWMLYRALNAPELFGAPLAPLQRVDEFPENGLDGRHFLGVFYPLKYVVLRAFLQFHEQFYLFRWVLLLTYIILSICGIFAVARMRNHRQSVIAFICCSIVICVAVWMMKPHLAYRFVLYPFFTITPLLFILGLQMICAKVFRSVTVSGIATLLAVSMFCATYVGYRTEKMGYTIKVKKEAMQVIEFAATTDPQSLFAIWPAGSDGFELIPYLARRPVLVMRKAHYPTFEKHIFVMRDRMNALVEAYLTLRSEPLRELQCRLGVDYLVLRKDNFAADAKEPAYFAPFDEKIHEVWKNRRYAGSDFPMFSDNEIAFDTQQYRIIKLAGAC